jgi:HAD superfamily hydrolase (TIGR01509 family)
MVAAVATLRAVILDVDGTLIDSNYHHVLAWVRAFRTLDVVVPAWRIHRHVGMGGDQLVAAVAGDAVERERGDDIRAAEERAYLEYLPHVRPFPDAPAFLGRTRELGLRTVLASSAKAHELDRYLELLDAERSVDAWTSSADVDRTKPYPDLMHVALERAAADEAVMVGDATWDVEAARRAGLSTIAVLTGGYGREELIDAGAVAACESLGVLARDFGWLLPAALGRPEGQPASAGSSSSGSR